MRHSIQKSRTQASEVNGRVILSREPVSSGVFRKGWSIDVTTSKRMPHVAVWIETSRGYGRGLIRGVASYVRQHGPWSIYFSPHGLREPIAGWLRNWKGDGILARIDDRRMARMFSAKRVPLIDLRGRFPGLPIPVVGLANRPVAELAFVHLRERGFRHFAFCGLRVGEHVHLDQRRDFFVALAKESGFDCHVFPEKRSSMRSGQSPQDLKQLEVWLRNLPKPIGIMSCNDDRGQQLLDACRRIDANVPDQIAVVGVDNDEEICNLSTPSLSSVDVNAERIGYAAAELLDRMISGKKFPGEEVLFEPSHVVARLSSDTLNVDDPSLSRALRYIRDHADKEISVDQVVEAALVSRRYLERLMISQIGRSPHQEILRVRMERAKLMLRDSSLTLGVIAQQCGFSSAKYFGDAFQRQTGSPPGEYRRQVRDARFQDRMPQSRVAQKAKRS